MIKVIIEKDGIEVFSGVYEALKYSIQFGNNVVESVGASCFLEPNGKTRVEITAWSGMDHYGDLEIIK